MPFLAALPAEFAAMSTLAQISTGASIIGAITSASGAVSSASANSQALQYQSAVARNNQILADQYAAQATARGEVQAQQKGIETAQRQGAVRAAVGASGLDTSSGSPLRLQQDTEALGNLDVATIRNNAAREAFGYKVQGMDYGAQATLDERAASNATKAGNLGAWGSIISGAAAIGPKWQKWQTPDKSPLAMDSGGGTLFDS